MASDALLNLGLLVTEIPREPMDRAIRSIARLHNALRVNVSTIDEICAAPITKQCVVCKADNVALMVCSRCNAVRYCSQACQRTHWPAHRIECSTLSYSLGPSAFLDIKRGCVRALVDLPKGKAFRVQAFNQSATEYAGLMTKYIEEFLRVTGLTIDHVDHEHCMPLVVKLLEAGSRAPRWIETECQKRDAFNGFERTAFDAFVISKLEATYGEDKVRDAFNTVIPTFYKTPNISQCQLPRVLCSMAQTKRTDGANCVFITRPNLNAIVLLEDIKAGEELIEFNMLADTPLI